MEISTLHIVIVLLTAITAYTLKGITGFGLSLIMMPILSLFLDFRVVIMIVTLADMLSSGLIYWQKRKEVRIKEVGVIIFGLLSGTLIGVALFSNFPAETLKKIFGVFLIAFALKEIFKRSELKNKWKYRPQLAFLSGFAGGICGGMFNVNGPPIVMYMKNTMKDVKLIRSSLSAVFFIDAALRGFLFWQNGYLTPEAGFLFAMVILPGMILGQVLVNFLISKMDNKIVAAIIEFALIFLGGGLVFN